MELRLEFGSFARVVCSLNHRVICPAQVYLSYFIFHISAEHLPLNYPSLQHHAWHMSEQMRPFSGKGEVTIDLSMLSVVDCKSPPCTHPFGICPCNPSSRDRVRLPPSSFICAWEMFLHSRIQQKCQVWTGAPRDLYFFFSGNLVCSPGTKSVQTCARTKEPREQRR